jgi:type VII secretion-associated serine protease mycosin
VSSDPLVKQQWAQQDFAFSALWPCGRGAGVTVAVVDTGVQADHPDLSGRVLPGTAFLNNGPAQPGAGGTDPNGHGTHVAGIVAAGENGVGIVGVAPEATILPVKVLGADGNGLSTDIAQGITWAVDQSAAVINLSLGSDLDSPSIDAAVDYATSHGVVVVAAAGNTGNTGNAAQFPAALPSVIAVAAIKPDHAIAPYSTRGNYVDVAAPGSSILSTIPPATWANKSGTSMSSPHVAGLAALIIDARGAITPAAMLNRLTSTATDTGAPGFDPAYGWGLIDPIAALNAA